MDLSFRTKSIIKMVLLHLLVASTPAHGQTATATTMSHRTAKRGLRGGDLRELTEPPGIESGPGSGASPFDTSVSPFLQNGQHSGIPVDSDNANPGEGTFNIPDSLPATEPAADDPVATYPLPAAETPQSAPVADAVSVGRFCNAGRNNKLCMDGSTCKNNICKADEKQYADIGEFCRPKYGNLYCNAGSKCVDRACVADTPATPVTPANPVTPATPAITKLPKQCKEETDAYETNRDLHSSFLTIPVIQSNLAEDGTTVAFTDTYDTSNTEYRTICKDLGGRYVEIEATGQCTENSPDGGRGRGQIDFTVKQRPRCYGRTCGKADEQNLFEEYTLRNTEALYDNTQGQLPGSIPYYDGTVWTCEGTSTTSTGERSARLTGDSGFCTDKDSLLCKGRTLYEDNKPVFLGGVLLVLIVVSVISYCLCCKKKKKNRKNKDDGYDDEDEDDDDDDDDDDDE